MQKSKNRAFLCLFAFAMTLVTRVLIWFDLSKGSESQGFIME